MGIKTLTIHNATRFPEKETVVMMNGKEHPIKRILCKENKIILLVGEDLKRTVEISKSGLPVINGGGKTMRESYNETHK